MTDLIKEEELDHYQQEIQSPLQGQEELVRSPNYNGKLSWYSSPTLPYNHKQTL
jgi:hypothetical protein